MSNSMRLREINASQLPLRYVHGDETTPLVEVWLVNGKVIVIGGHTVQVFSNDLLDLDFVRKISEISE